MRAHGLVVELESLLSPVGDFGSLSDPLVPPDPYVITGIGMVTGDH